MHIRRALAIFAASAPLGAILTYAIIGMLGSHLEQHGDAAQTLKWWTGELLTVSGGTFLFVATHVMKAAEPDAESDGRERFKRTLLMLAGMVAPIAGQAIVGHAH